MKIFYLILLLIATKSFCQTIISKNDNIEIEFHKAKKTIKAFSASSIWISTKEFKQVYVRVKMISLDKKKYFNINKFSLIDIKNKIRYRPIDIFSQFLTDWQGIPRLTKKKVKNKRSNPYWYDPSVEDSFLKYNFEEYTNCNFPINFGRKTENDYHTIYFRPKKFKTKFIMLFFPYPREVREGVIYYGHQKLAEISVK